jgi:tol-pal system protein YbgF
MFRSVLVLATLVSLGLGSPAGAQGKSSGDGDQEKRLQRLEEQIVDLNAQIGTVESMTRGAGGAPAGGGGYSGSGGDVGQMESQLRAMGSQLNEIMRRLERLESRSGMAPAPGDAPSYGDAAPRGGTGGRQGRGRPAESGTGFSIGGLDDQQDGDAGSPPPQQPASRGSFSSDTTRGDDRSSGSGWATESAPAPSGAVGGSRGAQTSSAPVRVAALSSPQAQSLYDQAYGAFTQRNYRAASEGFEQFLQRHPTDPLAGTAQFWLGEAAFTGGEYRKAADLFLKTTTNYPDNEKAAESMLKLGISLKRLGENDAACGTFSELSKRYPNASALLQRAETEKRRSNC